MVQKPLATRLEQLLWPLSPGRELLPGVFYQGAQWKGVMVLQFGPTPAAAPGGGGEVIRVGLSSRHKTGTGLLETKHLRVFFAGQDKPPPAGPAVLRAVTGLVAGAEKRFARVEYAEMAAALRQWEEPVTRNFVGEVRIIIRCNETCPFCHSDERSENVVFDMAAYRRTLERFREKGVRYLVISGGEPTLRPDLEDFVALGAQMGFPEIELQTNGTRLARDELARRLKQAGLHKLLVSLHSPNAGTLAFITGRKNAMQSTLAGVDAALAAGLRVTINNVVTPHNVADVPGFPDFLHNRFGGRIEHVLFSVASPHFESWRESSFFPNPADVGQALSAALRRAAALGLPAFVPNLCGVPACVLDEDMQDRHVDQSFSTEGYQNHQGRVFPLACGGCGFRDGCTGVWAKTVERYGGDWVRPIAAPLPLKMLYEPPGPVAGSG